MAQMNKIKLILSETLTKYARQLSILGTIFLLHSSWIHISEFCCVTQVIYEHQRSLRYFRNYESKC